MATLFDTKTGKAVAVPDSSLPQALASGALSLPKGSLVSVRSPTGEVGTIPAEQALDAFESGYTYYGDAQHQADLDRQRYEGPVGQVEALGAGAARGLTFGGSDVALTKTGAVKPETLAKLKEHDPVASYGGELGGMLLPAIATGGGSAAVEGAEGAADLARAGSAAADVAKGGAGISGLVRGAAELAPPTLVSHVGEAAADFTRGMLGDAPQGAGLIRKAIAATAPRMVGGATEMAAYGAADQLSNDILGDKDVTAEKLLAGAGLGAIGGAIGSGLLGAGGLAARAGLEKLGDVDVGRALKDFAEDRAVKAIGASAKDVEKLSASRRITGLGRALLDNGILTPTSTYQDMAERAAAVQGVARQGIDGALGELDARVAAAPGLAPASLNPTRLADKFESEVLDPLAKSPIANVTIVPKLQQQLEALRAIGDKPMSFLEADALKKSYDGFLNWNSPEPPAYQDALRKLRGMINGQIEASARDVAGADSELYSRFKDSKTLYGHMADAGRILGNVTSKTGNRFLDPTMLMGALLGGPHGLLKTAAYSLAESYGPQTLALALDRITQLHAVGKMADAVTAKIEQAAEAAIASTPARYEAPAIAKVLDGVQFTDRAYPSPAKDADDALRRRVSELQAITANPALAQRMAAAKAAGLGQLAPGVAQSVQSTAQKALLFLGSKVPAAALPPMDPKSRLQVKASPSDVAKFARYVRAVEDPTSLLADLRHGVVSPEAKEAVQAVHPKLFAHMGTKVMEKLQLADKHVPYAKRQAIAQLFDVPADPSMVPATIATMQRTYVTAAHQTPKARKPPARGLRSTGIATEFDALEDGNRKA